MQEDVREQYRISIRPSSELDTVEHQLNDMGYETLRKRPGFHVLEVKGPQSSKTRLSRVPGVEHVVPIFVKKGD